MDDLSLTDVRLTRALDNLRQVNRWLGGYAATLHALAPLLLRPPARPLRVLDLATGVADFPSVLVRRAARRNVAVEVVAVDVNEATVAYGRQVLDRELPPDLRRRVRVQTGDALALPFEDRSFDACTTALFLHHLAQPDAVRLVREMRRVSRYGFVINDLHRHPVAYYSIKALAAILPVSPMFRHDGPVSVLRAFTREELRAVAHEAGIEAFRIRWHWAFRWTLSTIEPDPQP